MTQEERVRELIRKLRRCFRFIHHRSDGGRCSQIQVLRELRYHGDMTQRRLREHMNIQQSSLSEIVKKMEEQRLIQRSVCDTDRRQMQIGLSEQGRRLLEKSDAVDLQQNMVYMQVLTAEEQQTLLELLTKLDQGWTELYRCRPEEAGKK